MLYSVLAISNIVRRHVALHPSVLVSLRPLNGNLELHDVHAEWWTSTRCRVMTESWDVHTAALLYSFRPDQTIPDLTES